MPSLLVIGGARSGKSRYAQSRAEATELAPLYIATAQPFDNEMEERIARHRADRGPQWHTIDAPLGLPEAIMTHERPDRVLLVDCLTLWITNLLFAKRDIAVAVQALITAVNGARGSVILVSNEVGWGIVPDNAIARRFRDEVGYAHQRIAKCVDEVRLIYAGLDLRMK